MNMIRTKKLLTSGSDPYEKHKYTMFQACHLQRAIMAAATQPITLLFATPMDSKQPGLP